MMLEIEMKQEKVEQKLNAFVVIIRKEAHSLHSFIHRIYGEHSLIRQTSQHKFDSLLAKVAKTGVTRHTTNILTFWLLYNYAIIKTRDTLEISDFQKKPGNKVS